MTDLAAIGERHVGIVCGSDGIVCCYEDAQPWPCDAAQLLALLADTPSVEPPAVSHEAPSTTGQANSGGGRDTDIARIAAVLNEWGLSGWQRGVGHQLVDNFAAALYDAGLRPSVEPHSALREAIEAARRWHDRHHRGGHATKASHDRCMIQAILDAFDAAPGLADTPSAEPALDEAWRETEAALPDGWAIGMVWGTVTSERWGAMAGPWPSKANDSHEFGGGDTPAAALRQLAVRLTERDPRTGELTLDQLRARSKDVSPLLPTQASDSPEKP